MKPPSLVVTLILVYFLCVSNFAIAQNISGTESTDSTNIYCHALSKFLSSYEFNSLTVLIEANDLTQEKCSPSDSSRVQYINALDVKKLLQKKHSIIVVRIIPLRVKHGDFFVNFIPFEVSKEKTGYRYANSGGVSVHYKFNAETQLFELREVKVSGI